MAQNPAPATPTHANARIKRALRDLLTDLDSRARIELQGPMGVGKRSLARQLPNGVAKATHHRKTPSSAGVRQIRVHPLTVAELGLTTPRAFTTLLGRGGFPNQLWADQPPNTLPDHLSSVLGASCNASGGFDMRASVGLWGALTACVGRPLSIRAVAGAVGMPERKASAWAQALHAQHGFFTLAPLPSPTADATFRALKKGQKHYPYDWSQGHTQHARLEALVANHLLQWVESSQDLAGEDRQLMYFRDCDQREVDFVVLKHQRPEALIQIDPLADQPNRHLAYLARKFPTARAWQLSLGASMAPVQAAGLTVIHPLAFLLGLPGCSLTPPAKPLK